MTSETINNDGINFEEIEKDVKKTTLGQWLMKNTQLVVVALVGVTVIALSVVWFNQWQESKKSDSATLSYEFETTHLKSFEEKKTEIGVLNQNYTELASSIEHKASLIPLSLKISNIVVEQTKEASAAITILETTIDKAGSNTDGIELVQVQLASLYEDSNQVSKSVETLENIKKSLPEYLGAYVYFHLGRIYSATGETEKAKEHLNYVVEKYEDTEEAKLAKIILTEI